MHAQGWLILLACILTAKRALNGREGVLKIRLLPAFVLAILALTVQAKSATLVYLVGVRHVYAIPVYPDAHQLDRQQIEEDYAAAVADAQKHYDADMASIHDEEAKDSGNIHQQDRDAVQENLEKDIADASDRREAALAQIYPVCDSVRSSHPEFAVDQDGPYRVIEVETAPSGEYSNVVYYQPYPMYMDPCPFGWAWGEPYPFLTWGVQLRLFHSMWITIGCPFFAPMYYGGGVFVFSAPVRTEVIVNRTVWVGGRPPHITSTERAAMVKNYEIQKKSGYFDKGPGGKPLSQFKQPVSTASRYSNAGAVSRYSRSYSHGSSGAATGTTGASRYSHSLPGSSSAADTRGVGLSRSSRTGVSTNPGSTSGFSRYSRAGSATSGPGTQSGISRYGRTGSTTTEARPVSTSGGNSGTAGSHGSQSGSASSGSTQHSVSGSSNTAGSNSHASGSSGSHSTGGSSGEAPKKKGNGG